MVNDIYRWLHNGVAIVYVVDCEHGVEYVGSSGDLGRPTQHRREGRASIVTYHHPPIAAPRIVAVFENVDLARDAEHALARARRNRGFNTAGGGLRESGLVGGVGRVW